MDEEEDPASIEHFGISTVEVMSSGVIPIALNRGGSLSIINNGVTGFLAGSSEEYIKSTLEMFNMTATAALDMQTAARAATERFTFEHFSTIFDDICTKGLLSAGFRSFVKQDIGVLHKKQLVLNAVSRKIALIVEPVVKPEFEYAVRNVMTHLGPEWGLVVVHSKANAVFVHHVLKDLVNVRFYGLELDASNPDSYQHLFKSAWFWSMLQADKAFVFQSDSIMIGGGRSIDEFLSYDFVAAPWHLENKIWDSKDGTLIGEGVGNGGLSLRSVAAMVHICETRASESPANEAEDLFFVRSMLEEGYNFPSRQVAYTFAQEVPCPDLTDVIPLCLHARRYYSSQTRKRYFRSRDSSSPSLGSGRLDSLAQSSSALGVGNNHEPAIVSALKER